MRTTVDLPPALHARAKALAEERGTSLSAVIADLTARGLTGLDDSVRVHADPVSGLPTIRTGRRITSEQVADLIAED